MYMYVMTIYYLMIHNLTGLQTSDSSNEFGSILFIAATRLEPCVLTHICICNILGEGPAKAKYLAWGLINGPQFCSECILTTRVYMYMNVL